MNNLIWRSVTCRPGKKSVLPKGKTEPCSRRRYRQTRPEGRSPPLRGCLRSGYALPSTPPQRHSHPDCRAILTLIVALDKAILGDLLLTGVLENVRHREGHDEQVQRCYAAHYLASWIDLPKSAGHLRGVPESIVAMIAD